MTKTVTAKAKFGYDDYGSVTVDSVAKLCYNDSAFLLGEKQMEWDETKHPRGNPENKGQFTSVNGNAGKATELDRAMAAIDGVDFQSALKKRVEAVGFADKTRKNTAHHRKHAKELGFKNQDEYERAAADFFNGSEGKLFYSRKEEKFYRYDEKTGRMVVSKDGTIYTFMKRSKKEFQRIIQQEDLIG